MITELRDILFLDIETVAITNNYQSLDERLKVQWSRKASYFKKEEEKSEEALFHEKAGIYAEFGKIICISIGKFFDHESRRTRFEDKSLLWTRRSCLVNRV